MSLETRVENETVVIGLSGHIDSSNSDAIEKEILAARASHPEGQLTLDAEKLEYISSAGLRVILRLSKAEPSLKVINVSSAVYEVFEMTGFNEMTPINAIYVYGMALELTLVAILSLPSYFAATFGGSKELVSIFRHPEEDIDLGQPLQAGAGPLTLKEVGFSYGKKAAVDHVSLFFPEGKVTAIIGMNGSGKSTLVKVIDRLYPLEQGEIRLQGQKGTDISLKSWREHFAVVGQNASLFSGSIRSNIVYGLSHEVSEEELNRVVHLAQLDDVIAAHPGGLDYPVGIKGSHLSGGEQERVAIARALLKNPPYLILDEATANLDAKTEDEINEGLAALMQGRTVLFVAHHYAPVKAASYVVVMDHGKVADSGTPSELLARNAYYQSLAQSD